MCLCVLLSSTILIMRDEDGKVLTASNMFYNTLSARQALRRHRRWSRRRPLTSTLMPMSLPRLLRRRQHPDIVSGTDLLPLPVINLHCIDMHCHCQAGSSTIMSNALRGIYLLITALYGKWSISNWHLLRGMKRVVPTMSQAFFFTNFSTRSRKPRTCTAYTRHVLRYAWDFLF